MATAVLAPPTSTAAAPVVSLDASTGQQALRVDYKGGSAWLNGRRDPVGDAERWLAATLREDDPPVIVLIGLGLGYVLDALDRRGSTARVLAMEPFEDVLPHFHARRNWSDWLSNRRLQIVSGPSYQSGREAWSALDPDVVPPVLVSPALAASFSSTVAGARIALNRARRGSRLDLDVSEVKQSMLHPTVLTTLEHFASTVNGVIVEIGAYVGGATMAMARGIRDSGRDISLVTIEPGGDHSNHPYLPSTDIAGDLRSNLRSRELDRYVTLYEGYSSDAAALELVKRTLDERQARIGMLCIDADGRVQRDFDLYLPLCASGCVLSIDDYVSTQAPDKTGPTQAAVNALLAEGRATELGVYGYGTWMGILRDRG